MSQNYDDPNKRPKTKLEEDDEWGKEFYHHWNSPDGYEASNLGLNHTQWLELKIKSQKDEITHLQQTLAHKNKILDAMLYVWCSGGCEGGVNRFTDSIEVTEELVKLAVDNTNRLQSWFSNYKNNSNSYKKLSEEETTHNTEKFLANLKTL